MKYGTITADPPWPYDTTRSGRSAMQKPLDGPGKLHKSDGTESLGVHDFTYPIMEISEICALPVSDWAEPDAHLWLWTTNAFMREAYQVVDAWGFTPKTILTWGKVKKDDPTCPSMKVGHYLRGATEHAILAVRGKTPKPVKAVPTLLLTPRIQRHSQKPDEFYDVVESVSPGPYLEMFSRKSHDGWDAWGNQTGTLDETTVEATPAAEPSIHDLWLAQRG